MFEPPFIAHIKPETVPGEILVKYKEAGLMSREGTTLRKTYHVQVLASYVMVGIQRLKVAAGETVTDVIAKLSTDPAVELAEPNYKVFAFEKSLEPSDPRWKDL